MVKQALLEPSESTKPSELTLSRAVTRTGSSAIRDLLHVTELPHVTSLAGGLPNPRTFPIAEIEEAVTDALADDPTAALQYGPTEGHRSLRSWIAHRMQLDDDQLDQVVVTTGAQQALDLLARALLDPGDAIALADPAYVGAIQAFRSADANLVAIPADGDGMQVDALAEQLADGLRLKAVYIVANFDNPTGATLSADRRGDLAALADRYGFWIIDDDPYGELRWAGTAPIGLRHLSDHVITVGSTSKVLCPGLRIGWVVGPPRVSRAITGLKQSADLHTSSLSQQVAVRVLERPGFLPDHLATLRATYRVQAESLAGALDRHLGDRATFQTPQGGMFIWVELAGRSIDTTELLPCAVGHGVAYVPGRAFSVADPHAARMRLSFATCTPDELDDAVGRLAVALA